MEDILDDVIFPFEMGSSYSNGCKVKAFSIAGSDSVAFLVAPADRKLLLLRREWGNGMMVTLW